MIFEGAERSNPLPENLPRGPLPSLRNRVVSTALAAHSRCAWRWGKDLVSDPTILYPRSWAQKHSQSTLNRALTHTVSNQHELPTTQHNYRVQQHLRLFCLWRDGSFCPELVNLPNALFWLVDGWGNWGTNDFPMVIQWAYGRGHSFPDSYFWAFIRRPAFPPLHLC